MPFYEVIFESGAHSVAEYEDDTQATEGLQAHHNRALNGEAGGPAGQPAERLKRVLVYDRHPAEYGSTFTAPPKQITDAVNRVIKSSGDQVDIPEVISTLFQEADSMVTGNHPHESQYKMQEERELELKWL